MTDNQEQATLLLKRAILEHDVVTAKVSIECGADLDKVTAYGDTQLLTLIDSCHDDEANSSDLLKIVVMLLGQNNNVNQANMYGTTALMVASSHGLFRVAEHCLSMGADPNAVDKAGFTALSFAVRSGDLSLARLLLANGATCNAGTKNIISLVPDPQGRGSFLAAVLRVHV